MRLLTPEHFTGLFDPLAGKRIGFLQGKGNVGDALIRAATMQLFDEWAIRWVEYDPDRPADVDLIVYGGGGNMGSLYPDCQGQRLRCLATGLPVTVFPQSFSSREDLPYARVYVRERASLELAPSGAELAPDLAFGLDYAHREPAQRVLGLFLRRDKESAVRRPWFVRDPIRHCVTPESYLQLAAAHENIITDRLHMAIGGLICGRRVILLKNAYHKNRSMHETWMHQMGCGFADSVEQARRLLHR